MTYTYDTGKVSSYALKRVNHSCHKDENRTRMVGIMCKSCPFYEGFATSFINDQVVAIYHNWHEARNYVVCTGFEKDDEGPGAQDIRSAIYSSIKHAALCATCY